MLSDLQTDFSQEKIEADICIIGAGAAGITMAMDLIDKPWNVVVLEAGGTQYNKETQNLFAGKNIGREYFDLLHERLRFLGGTTNHWGGWCAPLAPIDLAKRSWVPLSGWPMSWEELEAYYPRAQELCQLGRYDYDPKSWLGDKLQLLDFERELYEHYAYHFSPPTQFGRVYSAQLKKAKNINVIMHANVVDMVCNDGVSHMQTVQAQTLSGKRLSVSAKTFVLASGGIETARLLLATNKQNAKGLANDNDLVGRYFMEHLEGIVGHIQKDNPNDARWLNSYSKRVVDGQNVQLMSAARLSATAQEKLQVLNVGHSFRSEIDQNTGYLSAKRLALTALGRKKQSSYLQDMGYILGDLDEIARWVYHRSQGTNYQFPVTNEPAAIWAYVEQEPNPSSRITLIEEKDALGMPRIALDWRVTALEKRTISESSKHVAQEISRLTGMRVQLDEWVLAKDDFISDAMHGGHHHMGTTRMSDTAQTGVVDKDCKVFGIDNLFIASSSVFPTSGYANPTLTIVALASRLAGHLDQLLVKQS